MVWGKDLPSYDEMKLKELEIRIMAKMATGWLNLPDLNDRVRLRSKGIEGRVVFVNPENNWARVEWEEKGPTLCHLYELEKVV